MNTTRLARALLTAVLFAFTGCGGSSVDAPTIPPLAPVWYDGNWDAISADGVAMPATLGSRRYSYFSLSVERSLTGSRAFISIGYTFGPQGPQGMQPEVFACAEQVEYKLKGDTLFTTEYDGKTKCSSVSMVRHTFVRSGAQMKSVYWTNTTFILQKR